MIKWAETNSGRAGTGGIQQTGQRAGQYVSSTGRCGREGDKLRGNSRDQRGTRFDVRGCGSRRINGVRNIRQALASPHPAVRLTIRRGPPELRIRNLEFGMRADSGGGGILDSKFSILNLSA